MDRHAAGRSNMRLRGMVSAVLAFLASLFLSLLVLLLTLQTTLLSPAFMKKQVDNSRYIPHIIEDMESVFVSYGMSSNFDEAFFTSVLDATAVKKRRRSGDRKAVRSRRARRDTEAFRGCAPHKAAGKCRGPRGGSHAGCAGSSRVSGFHVRRFLPGGGAAPLGVLCFRCAGCPANAGFDRYSGFGGLVRLCTGVSLSPAPEKKPVLPFCDLCAVGRGADSDNPFPFRVVFRTDRPDRHYGKALYYFTQLISAGY